MSHPDVVCSLQLAHIGAVPIVLAEGRSAMVTASSMFKYMFTYGLIQTTSVIVLYR
jgi:magnesium-transporting ATPase (P-type)